MLALRHRVGVGRRAADDAAPDRRVLRGAACAVRVRPWRFAQAAASVEATARLQALTQRILADVGNDAWSRAPADLVELHGRLDREWRSWRQALEPVNESAAAGR